MITAPRRIIMQTFEQFHRGRADCLPDTYIFWRRAEVSRRVPNILQPTVPTLQFEQQYNTGEDRQPCRSLRHVVSEDEKDSCENDRQPTNNPKRTQPIWHLVGKPQKQASRPSRHMAP